MRKQKTGITALATLALLLAAGTSQAATLDYIITGGEIIVTATAGGQLLAQPLQMTANGESISIDLTPGSEQVLSLALTATGPVEIALDQPIGGYGTLRVDTLEIMGGPGFLIPVGPAPPDVEFFAAVENVVLSASFALVDDFLPDEPGVVAIPLGIATGPLFVAMTGNEINMFGIAQNDVMLPGIGQSINFKADFNFTGVLIPEPSGAVVFALGLLPIARALRRERVRDAREQRN